MGRDDSALYTGASSASFSSQKSQQLKEQRELQQQERKETQQKLKPSGEIVLELIAKHKAKANLIENFDAMLGEEHLKSEIMARQKFIRFLDVFQQEIKNKLREAPIEEPQS